ncbi:MAG: hypothetical protein WC241_04895 [Candidatus Paceibacterota bacterium]|jgi:hypothetical protein
MNNQFVTTLWDRRGLWSAATPVAAEDTSIAEAVLAAESGLYGPAPAVTYGWKFREPTDPDEMSY